MARIIKMQGYEDFRCIADRCSFSCCKGWEIAVDSLVLGLWEKDSELSRLLRKDNSGCFIKLRKDKACPYLNQNELCDLMLTGREKYLTSICRSFPRLVNQYDDREEYSLSCACPEVIDIIHREDGISFIGDKASVGTDSKEVMLREVMLSLIHNKAFSLNERIQLIFHLLTALQKMPETSETILRLVQDGTYLESLIEEFRELTIPLTDFLSETNELLLDIIKDYHKEPGYEKFLNDIHTAAKGYEKGKKFNQKQWDDFISSFKTYEELLTDIITLKLFHEGAGICMEDMIMSFQMIVTEYIMIRYSAFLKSMLREIDYYEVRDLIVIYSRIIGYNPEGIREFWLESFDDAVWELGYALLLIG